MLIINDRRWAVMGWVWRKASRSHDPVANIVQEIRAAREAEDAQTPIIAAQTAYLVRGDRENGFVSKLTAGFQRKTSPS